MAALSSEAANVTIAGVYCVNSYGSSFIFVPFFWVILFSVVLVCMVNCPFG